MGREIRRVVPNWEHPKREFIGPREDDYQPMYDRCWEDAFEEFLDYYKKHGTKDTLDYFGSPPDPQYHRPKWTEDGSWYQVYETVTEGTPVSPPFETKEELVKYLSENGDFWAQRRGSALMSYDKALEFVNQGWVPSGMISGWTVKANYECLSNDRKEIGEGS